MEGGGRGFRVRETHIYLWLIHADVWQKPSQYCNYPPIKIYKQTNKQFYMLVVSTPSLFQNQAEIETKVMEVLGL